MANLGASHASRSALKAQLLDALYPSGGSPDPLLAGARRLRSVMPLLAEQAARPMERGPDGVCVGVYWSRALSAAVAVGLAPAAVRRRPRRRSGQPKPPAPGGITPIFSKLYGYETS